jgi:hypothetical protein
MLMPINGDFVYENTGLNHGIGPLIPF